jgi:hypothetical protein
VATDGFKSKVDEVQDAFLKKFKEFHEGARRSLQRPAGL